jgi:hypothetical protein
MSTPNSFLDLQAGFYNALSQGLGYSPKDPFQVIQPSPPLSNGLQADALLWNYFNNIPPFSLTQNTVMSGGNQFLSNYQGVMSALMAAPNGFEEVVGATCYNSFRNALQKDEVKPGALPFRNWAMFSECCSSVAVQGASALAAAMLDPIFAAQMNVTPYSPAGTSPVTFTPNFTTMFELLKKAPSRSFEVAQNNWNSDIQQSWSKGSNSGFFGLWGGSSSTSTLSKKFASGGVSISANFQNVLPFNTTPGDWYSSAALGMAYNNPGKRPWVSNNPINWETTFGENGNLQRFATSLLIANKMDIRVTSHAKYSEQEQTEIKQNSGAGMWPFYSSSGSHGSSTDVGFDSDGKMTVHITSDADVPVVIGCTVLSAGEYLGHEDQASKLIMSKFFS